MMAFNVQIGLHKNRLSVDMHHPFFAAVNCHFRCTKAMYICILIKVLGEKQQPYQWRIKRRKRMYDSNIYQSVMNAGIWRDECVVAILSGVASSCNKCLFSDFGIRSLNYIFLAIVFKIFSNGFL